MTKSLVVNCSLSTRAKNEELLKAIRKFSECTAVQFRDIHAGYEVEKDIDAVVLSGSAARIVNPNHRDKFQGIVNLINRLDLPIFSICYGHQLLCWALGARVASLAEPVMGRFERVRVVEVDEIFAGFEKYQTIPLAQSHYDYVLKESLDQAGLVLLADSNSCEVEAVKHKHNPFYGVQFHPERIEIKAQSHPEGYKVLENFYRNVVKR
jgi:GMP synthase-like glutamine amidotransferase